MPGTTTIYGLPYQNGDDAPDGPSLGQDLAEAVEAELARIDTAAAVSLRTFVRKTADQTLNAQSTIQNDNELLAAVAANTTYTFDLLIFYSTNSTADIKLALNFPAGATCAWAPSGLKFDGVDYQAGFNTVTWRASAGFTNALAGDGTSYNTARMQGVLRTAGTAGNLHLKWAQNTSNGSNTTVKADSYLILMREV